MVVPCKEMVKVVPLPEGESSPPVETLAGELKNSAVEKILSAETRDVNDPWTGV